jgi:hypothetical protein
MAIMLVVLRQTFQKRGGVVGGALAAQVFLICISGHFANFQIQRLSKNEKQQSYVALLER